MRIHLETSVRLLLVAAAAAAGCASESHRTLETESVESRGTPYSGPRSPVGVAAFANRSGYMSGVFSDGKDRLGSQARTILRTHLSQSGRFTVVDREDEDVLAKESGVGKNQGQDLTGATVLVGGEVTEFGRRETGDRILFGLGGRGKAQVAYAKVSLNVVDVRTSEVLYAIQGAGEYELSDREILGTGGTSGYDSTLNGKVLDLAIRDAVNKLVAGMEHGEWSAAGKP
jgi:curli biogenesis system outer membrane secretion channel CsgG